MVPSDKIIPRIDLKTVPIEPFEEQGNLYLKFELAPNPERYERRTVGGREYLYDKFDGDLIPSEAFEEAIKTLVGKKLHMVIPETSDNDKYIEKRIDEVKDYLDGKEPPYQPSDASEEFLNKLQKDYEMAFVILCIDLKGSTKMSQSLSSKDNAKLVALFSREMGAIVNNYRGYVLKNVGDGLIVYFPIYAFPGMDDTAVDCAHAMKYFIEKCLNKLLPSYGLPTLEFRIGIDSGEAVVKTMGDSSAKQHKDLIGFTINLASKIQSVAKENHVVIGHTTLRGLHADKRKCFAEFTSNAWDYRLAPGGELYRLHIMTSEPERKSLVMGIAD